MTKGAFSIIKNIKGEILLVLRKDVPFWDLPGGRLEKGELPNTCLKRECLEETGLIVEPKYLIACYRLLFKNDEQYIYLSSIKGGKLIEDGPETKKIKFFNQKKLPLNLIPFRRMQIKDMYLNKRDYEKEIEKAPLLYRLQQYLKARN